MASDAATLDRHIQELTSRIKLDPKNSQARLQRGLLFMKLDTAEGDEAAMTDLSCAAELDPQSFLPLYNRALIYMKRGDYGRAVGDLDAALRLDPDDHLSLNNRGAAYERVGQFDRALRDFDRAIALAPTLLSQRIGKASALLGQEDFAGAVRACNEALKIGVASSLYRLRARALLRLERYPNALEDLDRLAPLGELDDDLKVERGIALRKVGRREEAVEVLSAVLRAAPDNLEALGQRAWTFAHLGKLSDAEDDLQRCYARNPEDKRVVFSLALIYVEAKRFAEATKFAKLAKSLGESRADAVLAMIAEQSAGSGTVVEGKSAPSRAEAAGEGAVAVALSPPNPYGESAVPVERPEPSRHNPEEREHVAVVSYPGREGYQPRLTKALTDEIATTAPPFRATGLPEPPRSKFEGYVRFIRFADLNEVQRAVFQLAFPKFFEEASTNAAQALDSALRGKRNEPAFTYRRFAGGGSLPRGRYFSICRPDNDSGDQTLAREVQAYADARHVGEVAVVDLSDPAAATLLDAYNRYLFADGSAPRSAIVARFGSRVGVPSRVATVMSRALGNPEADVVETAAEIPVFIPTSAARLEVDDVFDLRSLSGQKWLLDAVTKGMPNIDYAYTNAGRSPRLFVRGDQPTDFVALLETLMFHFRGGSPILDGIAEFLRSSGIAGVIYPSARSDPTLEIVDGQIKDWSGWCFVDYREAPVPRPASRVIADPDSWSETLARLTVSLARPSDRKAGSFRVSGNVDAGEAFKAYEAEIYYQSHYKRGQAKEFEKRYRSERLTSRYSLVEIRAALRAGYVNLDTILREYEGEDLQSQDTVSATLAAKIACEPEPHLESRFRTDSTWFFYRVGLWDAELLIRCAVCDFEELWPVHMGPNRPRCPRCGYAGTAEPPESVRARLLQQLFGRKM